MGVGGHKRLLVMLGFVLCLCGFARPALAAPKVGKVVNGSGDAATVDVQVIGSGISNGFSAAAWSFGVDPASLTAEQKTKLSNESTGGAFYRYAMAFQSGAHEPLTVALSSWYAVTLPQFVWTVEGYPYGDYAQARRDLKTIRDGGSLGGGGSGGEVTGDYVTYTMPLMFSPLAEGGQGYGSYFLSFGNSSMRYTTNLTNYTKSPSTQALLPPALTVRVDSEAFAGLSDSDLVNTCLMFRIHTSNDNYVYCNIFHAAGGFSALSSTSFVSKTVTNDGVTAGPFSGSFYRRGDVGFDGTLRRRFIQFNNGSSSLKTYEYRNGVLYLNVTDGAGLDNWTTKSDTTDAGYAFAAFFGTGGGGGSGGDNHWPDDDPTPTPDPPEVPGPSDDPIPQPDPPDLPNPVSYPVSDPYTPDPDPPTNPVITYDPDPTGDALDYRPWLNAILKLLRTINTTIDNGFYDVDVWLTEHCDHIREMMHKEALTLGLKMQAAINNGFVSFERWLQSTYGPYFFEELDATLRAILADYEDYLYDLFVWLSEQFDFSVSGGSGSYDDSTLLYWLQQIWAILAEKPSVGTEPDNFFDWLANLLAGILGGLVAWLLGALGGMADAVSGLATKFPFSLPWDIATMLALFVHEPVTPVFDLPFALPGEYANVRVDMSYFDEVMAAVRGVELVLFGLALAKRTPDMLELADTVFS